MAELKWIKITTDMFDNRKIKHLRKLQDGNNIVLIWIMLLAMAGKCNSDGSIFLTEEIPYTTKMLADELGFKESTVKAALKSLEQLNMISYDKDRLVISGWCEHQNIDGIDKIREQNRLRQAKHKKKQKLLADNATVTQSNVTDNATVTQSNAIDIDIDKEIEKDIDIFIYGKHKNVTLSQDEFEKLKTQFPSDYQDRIDKFSNGLATYGYKYKNHYLAILQWAENEKKESQPQYHPSTQVTEEVNWEAVNEEIQRNAVGR